MFNFTSPISETLSKTVNTITNQTQALLHNNTSPNTQTSNPINPFQLTLSITNSEKRIIGTETIGFYKIDLQSSLSQREWTVYHRYSDFYDLYTIFQKFYPHPPQITLNPTIKTDTLKDIHQYQSILTNFLLSVISRADFITSIYTIKFLQLEHHYHDIALYQPLQLYHLTNELQLPIKCAYLYEETNLLFLGLGQVSQKGLSGVLSKFNIGFFKSNTNQGQLVIYNILKNFEGASHFEPIYAKGLPSKATSINFYKEKNHLFVGMQNGHIAVFKLYITESSSESKDLAEEICTIKCHKTPIIGCYVNFQQGYVYSFAQETHMKISELNYQSLMKDIPVTTRELLIMKYDVRWGRVILCDETGTLYLVDVLSSPLNPQVIAKIINNVMGVSCLKTYFLDDYFIIGTPMGKCLFFKIRNYNQNIIRQEHMPCSAQIDIVKTKEINLSSCIPIKDVVVNRRNEVLIALDNGSIAIYVHEEEAPEFVIDAHLSSICCLFWEEEKKVLISCSEDKTVKMIQLPFLWPAENIRNNKGINKRKVFDVERDVKNSNNNYSFNNTNSIIVIKQPVIKNNPFYVERNQSTNTNDYPKPNIIHTQSQILSSFSGFGGVFGFSNQEQSAIEYGVPTGAKFSGNVDLRSTIEGEGSIISSYGNPFSTTIDKEKDSNDFCRKTVKITEIEKWSEDLDGWAL